MVYFALIAICFLLNVIWVLFDIPDKTVANTDPLRFFPVLIVNLWIMIYEKLLGALLKLQLVNIFCR